MVTNEKRQGVLWNTASHHVGPSGEVDGRPLTASWEGEAEPGYRFSLVRGGSGDGCGTCVVVCVVSGRRHGPWNAMPTVFCTQVSI